MAGVSFRPLSGNLSSSLLGVADPAKFTDPLRSDVRGAVRVPKRFPDVSNTSETIKYTVIIIIVSAIIFVTAIAVYDVIKTALSNTFAKQALTNPKSHNKPRDIRRTEIANKAALGSSAAFAAVSVVSAIVFVPLLLTLVRPPRL